MRGALLGIVQNFLVKSREDAIRWARELPEGESRTYAWAKMARILGGHDLDVAVEWTRQLPPGKDRDRALTEAVQAWALNHPETAVAWAQSLPAGEEQDRVFEAVVMGQVERLRFDDITFKDLIAAVEGLPAQYREPAYRAAMKWPPSTVTMAQGKADWLNAQPSGPQKDNMISDLFKDHVPQLDPGAAAHLALSITDEKRRQVALEMVARHWLTIDKDGAARWIRQSDLSADVKVTILATGK